MNTVTASNLIRDDIWSQRVKEELEEALIGKRLIDFVTDFPDGDTLHIPTLGNLLTRDYQENDDITVDDPAIGDFTLVIDKYVQTGIAITDKLAQDTFYMSVLNVKYPQKMIRAIMERLENDIFLLHKKQTSNNANTINGQPHRFVGSGSSNVIEIADMIQAKLSFDKANVSKVGRIANIDPTVAARLISLDQIVRQDVYGANSHIREGFGTSEFLGRAYGFDMFESNMLDEATALNHVAGGSLIANVFVGEEAFIGAMRALPEIESARNWEKKRDVFHATTRYGLDLFRPESLVVVLTG
jgi:hypothetical protein